VECERKKGSIIPRISAWPTRRTEGKKISRGRKESEETYLGWDIWHLRKF
jgi:hypothetical protein